VVNHRQLRKRINLEKDDKKLIDVKKIIRQSRKFIPGITKSGKQNEKMNQKIPFGIL
jgi:hypothetical protein